MGMGVAAAARFTVTVFVRREIFPSMHTATVAEAPYARHMLYTRQREVVDHMRVGRCRWTRPGYLA